MDGGSPQRTGTLTVNVNIQDLNDNPPIFSRQRYFTTISEDLPIGSSVFSVQASDADAGDNGAIIYAINRRQSDRNSVFKIDARSGLITLNKQLEFDRQQVHEIVVVARDGGEVPQETSAFVTVRVAEGDVGLHPPTHYQPVPSSLKLVFKNGDDIISESTKVNEAIAQIFLSNSAEKGINLLNFALSDESTFQVLKNSSGVFLLTRRKLNHHHQQLYRLTIDATDPGDTNRHFQDTFDIRVAAGNDHAPRFEQTEYSATLDESAAPGTQVITVRAHDKDKGDNGRISYSLKYDDAERSTDWFTIDRTTGVVSTQTFLDCESESNPSVVIVASDNGNPKLSASSTLSVSVADVNDNRPIFEKSSYTSELPEDAKIGDCFLKVRRVQASLGIVYSSFSTVHYCRFRPQTWIVVSTLRSPIKSRNPTSTLLKLIKTLVKSVLPETWTMNCNPVMALLSLHPTKEDCLRVP